MSSKLAAVLAVSFGVVLGGIWVLTPRHKAVRPQKTIRPVIEQVKETGLSLARVRDLVRHIDFLNAGQDQFVVETPEENYTIRTQLDVRLQKQLNATLEHLQSLARGKPQRIAMVAMDAESGMIKAMAGFDLDDPSANPCTVSDYPAASVFKIVTASAAVDSLGYTAQTPLYFNGQRYTLYKRQLNAHKNRYTSQVTLAEAFAESINPVFGKIGKNELGWETLNAYAKGFGFNVVPPTDFKIATSHFSATDNDYHLAELGCGFNHDTKISPVFGALMVATVLNRGQAPVPRVVARVERADGKLMYKSEKAVYNTPIKPRTAETMIQLMERTVSKGTAQKAFRGYRRDKILSRLTIGGKTGSLYSSDRTVKYDWFVGFGREKKSGQTLVVSVVVGHRKYIGTRAGTHARTILRTFFTARSDAPDNETSTSG